MATERPRYTVSVEKELFDQIEEYRFKNRFSTRSDATVDLISRGLIALNEIKKSPTPEGPKVEDIRKERIIRNYDQLNEKGRDALADYSNYQLTINKKEETVRVQAIARGGARVESEITLQEKKEILEEIDRMQKDIPDF